MAPFSDLRVVEGSAFVAAPLGGLTLAQLGADVIRFDTIGGGLDYARWPVTDDDVSLYWNGLNKGKRSIAINLARPEGRELATALITAPGENAGLFLSNFPESGWLSDERLRALRPDLVYVNIVGNPDETTAVDYTVNAASGIALATGPVGSSSPVNHALPAWDIATGLNAVIGLLAAERQRHVTGEGQLVKISLADVAFTMVANLGFLGQAQTTHANRPPLGNDMYGAFGRDFPTKDGRRVMVVAISLNQWQTLVRATERRRAPAGDGARVRRRLHAAKRTGTGRATPSPRCSRRGSRRTRSTRSARRSTSTACVGARTRRSRSCSTTTGGCRRRTRCSPTSTSPASARCARPRRRSGSRPTRPSRRSAAPLLGTHTDEVLADVLGMSSAEIGRLHDDGLVAGPTACVSEPVLADAGFSAVGDVHRRPRPRWRCSPPPSTPTRRCSRRARCRCRGTGRASVPAAPTAALGDDGHPRRRAEMAAFPQRMWVGGRIRETRVRSPSANRPSGRADCSAAEAKEGSSGRFWLVTVEHTITQGGEPCIEEEQDLVFARAVRGGRPGRRGRRRTGRRLGRGAHAPIRPCSSATRR